MNKLKSSEEYVTKALETRPKNLGYILYGSDLNAENTDPTKQIDAIVLVEDKKIWLKENAVMNPQDFTVKMDKFLKRYNNEYSPAYIQKIEVLDRSIKLGITTEEKHIENLTNWYDFSTAGRMQKNNIRYTQHNYDELYDLNRKTAFLYNLLLINEETINLDYAFESFFKMSYIGEIRNIFKSENPQKAQNEIKANKTFYMQTFLPLVEEYVVVSGNYLQIDLEKLKYNILKEYMPLDFINYLSKKGNLIFLEKDNKQIDYSYVIYSYLYQNVLKNSFKLAYTGLRLGGIKKGFAYFQRKRKKYKEGKKKN